MDDAVDEAKFAYQRSIIREMERTSYQRSIIREMERKKFGTVDLNVVFGQPTGVKLAESKLPPYRKLEKKSRRGHK